MANIFDYLIWRGDLPLSVSPFNEVDGAVFARLSYLPFELIMPCDSPVSVTIADAAAALISLNIKKPGSLRKENDAKLLLQSLPENVKNVHYHDDETHIRQLLEKYDLVPKRGASLAAATVRGLILTVSHKEQIGELYPQVLETLVYGACRELFE